MGVRRAAAGVPEQRRRSVRTRIERLLRLVNDALAEAWSATPRTGEAEEGSAVDLGFVRHAAPFRRHCHNVMYGSQYCTRDCSVHATLADKNRYVNTQQALRRPLKNTPSRLASFRCCFIFARQQWTSTSPTPRSPAAGASAGFRQRAEIFACPAVQDGERCQWTHPRLRVWDCSGSASRREWRSGMDARPATPSACERSRGSTKNSIALMISVAAASGRAHVCPSGVTTSSAGTCRKEPPAGEWLARGPHRARRG